MALPLCAAAIADRASPPAEHINFIDLKGKIIFGKSHFSPVFIATTTPADSCAERKPKGKSHGLLTSALCPAKLKRTKREASMRRDYVRIYRNVPT
jgi:hypothetical protein